MRSRTGHLKSSLHAVLRHRSKLQNCHWLQETFRQQVQVSNLEYSQRVTSWQEAVC